MTAVKLFTNHYIHVISFCFCFRETTLVVNICNSLAIGLIQPWVPQGKPELPASSEPSPRSRTKSPKRSSQSKPSNLNVAKSKGSVTISIEGQGSLKRAVEVRKENNYQTYKLVTAQTVTM